MSVIIIIRYHLKMPKKITGLFSGSWQSPPPQSARFLSDVQALNRLGKNHVPVCMRSPVGFPDPGETKNSTHLSGVCWLGSGSDSGSVWAAIEPSFPSSRSSDVAPNSGNLSEISLNKAASALSSPTPLRKFKTIPIVLPISASFDSRPSVSKYSSVVASSIVRKSPSASEASLVTWSIQGIWLIPISVDPLVWTGTWTPFRVSRHYLACTVGRDLTHAITGIRCMVP